MFVCKKDCKVQFNFSDGLRMRLVAGRGIRIKSVNTSLKGCDAVWEGDPLGTIWLPLFLFEQCFEKVE